MILMKANSKNGNGCHTSRGTRVWSDKNSTTMILTII
jgi:hypothetical protein